MVELAKYAVPSFLALLGLAVVWGSMRHQVLEHGAKLKQTGLELGDHRNDISKLQQSHHFVDKSLDRATLSIVDHGTRISILEDGLKGIRKTQDEQNEKLETIVEILMKKGDK